MDHGPVRLSRRRGASIALVLFALLIAASCKPTFVSLEFDDGTADQYQVRAMLNEHGMDGTFFVNSGQVGVGNYMTWAQLRGLAADGSEIGGHTLTHPDLTEIPSAEATREVCDDRAALLAQGFAVRNFAYPYGHNDANVQNIVRNCGYNSARDVSGIVSPGGCGGCPYAETIPPLNAYDTRTPENVNRTMPLSEIQGFVTQAEQHGGGWVQLVFHHICATNCGTYSISPSNFDALLDWLQPRAAQGTFVSTVGAIIGGPVKPPVGAPPRAQ
jgi:peptidoglycan/xylan/chitin deacetylase (PgdA/CDA1 family)